MAVGDARGALEVLDHRVHDPHEPQSLRQRAAPIVLERPRLEERLDESFGKRLTLLTAGAGFGKSTLLASWSGELECAWYTASARDAQLSIVAARIADALRPYLVAPDEFVAALGGAQDDSIGRSCSLPI